MKSRSISDEAIFVVFSFFSSLLIVFKREVVRFSLSSTVVLVKLRVTIGMKFSYRSIMILVKGP